MQVRSAWLCPFEKDTSGQPTMSGRRTNWPSQCDDFCSNLRSLDGHLGMVCIYQARDPESIRAHARRVGMPGDEIFPVLKSIVVREDLAAASAAA